MVSVPSSTLGASTPAMSAPVRSETRMDTARSTSSGSAPESNSVAISVPAWPQRWRVSENSASRAFVMASPATAARPSANSVSVSVNGPPPRFSVR